MLRANSRPLPLDLAWLPGCRAGDDIQAAGSARARKRAVSAPRLAASCASAADRTRQAGRVCGVRLRHGRSSSHRTQETRSFRPGHPSASVESPARFLCGRGRTDRIRRHPGSARVAAGTARLRESFLGLDDETGLAGAVSWARLQDGTLDICRLIVHHRVHRRGIATALLDSLDRAEPARRAVVSTGTANHPALALYKRRGFTPVGTRGIAPGTSITVLERWITPPSDPPIQLCI